MSKKKSVTKQKWYKKQLEMPFVKVGKGRWHRKGKKSKRKGRPLVAFRVDAKVLAGYTKKHGGTEGAWAALRRHMQMSGRKVARD
jgi:hypothetical protein